MTYSAEIIEDSITPYGSRLTTFVVTFPRFILAEFNTHRVLSRNSASSRAIPIPKQIARVRETPFVPLGFGGAQRGMVAAENLSGWRAVAARQVWLKSRYAGIAAAKALDWLGVHKAFANRVLEPWLWHTAVVTATEWENFFALRTDADAQPEFIRIAELMQTAYGLSRPKKLKPGEWHLPFVHQTEREVLPTERLPWISAGRCARVSFDTHWLDEFASKSVDRATGLSKNGHWSPFEHQARVGNGGFLSGNLTGDWQQFRKLFEHESNFAALRGNL